MRQVVLPADHGMRARERPPAAGTIAAMSRVVRSGVSAAAIPLALLAALLCVSVGVLVVAPAAAQEGDPAEAPAPEVPEPAIPVPDEDPAEPEPEWSYRFLVPATMLLGTVAVVGAIIMYFVRVTKNRYRVIR